MATTLTTLLADVRLELGNPGTGIISDATLTSRINDSYRELATRYRHPELVKSASSATVASTATIALQSDYWYTLILFDETNDQQLIYRPLNWIIAQDRTSTGQPQYWTRLGSNRILWPTPAGAYTITEYYVKRVTALSSGSDTTVFNGAEWDEILKWGAVWRAFHIQGEYNRMVHARNVWRTLVANMPETDTLESENAGYVVASLPGANNPIAHYQQGTR